MEDFLHIAFTWLHLLGVTLFVGPQFFLAFAWVPASRGITDLPTRVQAMRTITRRFMWLGGAGLVMAIVAGTYLIATWRDYYSVDEGAAFTDMRFGVVFIVKMTVLLVMLVAVGLHTFVVGPKLVDRLDAQARGETVTDAELRALRMRSMSLSIAGLLMVLAIMVMGVMLNTKAWSLA